MGSPLTLAKSKRWLPAIESSRGSPDRCEARECVQERRRAATKRRITQALFFLRWFFCPTLFCPRHTPGFVSRPSWLTTVVSKAAVGSYGVRCTACNAATTMQPCHLFPIVLCAVWGCPAYCSVCCAGLSCFCTLPPHALSAVIMTAFHIIMQRVHVHSITWL